MKLFLASQDFGDFAEDLSRLVGGNRRALIIADARDHRSDEYLDELLQRKLPLFSTIGLEAQRLDLREYFSKPPEDLAKYVDDYDPGLVYCLGGAVMVLATALVISGMDEIIRRRLSEDKMVFGGGSAGAMVASHDLELYRAGDDVSVEDIPAYAGCETVTTGLGLIDEYILPHVDQPEHKKFTDIRRAQISQLGEHAIELRDTDVFIVDGEHKILKTSKETN